jgi:radical SAM superfamily enzyme YgiQ (UPF0313 family)
MGSHFNSLVLGLSYISAVLNKKGHPCLIYNTDYLDDDNFADQREIFEGYEKYKSILNDEDHAIWKEIRDRVKEFSPKYVGISMHTGTYRSCLIIAKKIKEILPEVKIILGGPHPSILPEECLRHEFIDFIAIGEGEETLLELIEDKPHPDILGLGFKSGGISKINPKRPFIENLDLLPFPDRINIFPKPKDEELDSIITSRGCPFACTFCASKKIWGQKTRFRSIDDVFKEIMVMYDQFGIKRLHFKDDTFVLNKKRILDLCNRITDAGLKIKWTCDTRVDNLDEATLRLMKNAGCVRLKIGVDSGSDKILKKVKKGITTDQIKRGVDLIKKVGIKFTVYLLIGFPGETEEDIRETLEVARKLDANYNSLSIVAPYFGTEIYEDFIKRNGAKGIKEHWEYFYHQSKDMILTDGIPEELVDEFLLLNEGHEGKTRMD